jgi:uncharacterized membrane protein HdeD (DUF308 family)
MADGDSPVPHKPGWFLFLGIVYVLAGLMAIVTPVFVTLLSVVFFGTVLLIAGIATLIHAFWTHRWDGFAVQLLAGILASVAGFLLITDAAAGAAAITIILASYFLVSGLFRLGYGVMRASQHHRAALIVSGLVTLLLGVLIAVHWPSSSLWVIGTFVGVDLIFYGFSLITLARGLKG